MNIGKRKRDRHLIKRRANLSGSERRKKAKEAKWERKKLQPSQETFKWQF